MEGRPEGDVGTTRAFSEDEKVGVDLMIETESVDIADEIPHTTLPSSTSGQVDSDLSLLEPSGEAMGTSSDISLTTSSVVAVSPDFSTGNDKEDIPLANAEENDSPPWLKEWEKPEGEADVSWETHRLPATDLSVAATGLTVAGSSEKSFIYTQSPDTITEPNSESSANYQSDSSTDSYFLVSAEAMCAASVKIMPHNQRNYWFSNF